MPERPTTQPKEQRTADNIPNPRKENERKPAQNANVQQNTANDSSVNRNHTDPNPEKRRNKHVKTPQKIQSRRRPIEKTQAKSASENEPIIFNAFNSLLWCGFSSALFLIGWKYLPDDFFAFPKNSLLGFSVISIFSSLFCLFLPIFAFSYKYPSLEKRTFGKWPGRTWLIYSILLGIPAALIFTSIHNLVIFILLQGGHNIFLPAYLFPTENLTSFSLILAFLTSILIPSITTELYFRGVFFAQLPTNAGMFVPIVLSAFFYALYMQNPIDFLPYFLQGILFAYLRKKSTHLLCSVFASLFTSFFIHMFSAYFPLLPYYTSELEIGPWVLYTSAIALVSGSFILLILLKNIQKVSRHQKKTNSTQSPTTPDFKIRNSGPTIIFALTTFICVWLLLFSTFP